MCIGVGAGQAEKFGKSIVSDATGPWKKGILTGYRQYAGGLYE
jgi:hypothetical protein